MSISERVAAFNAQLSNFDVDAMVKANKTRSFTVAEIKQALPGGGVTEQRVSQNLGITFNKDKKLTFSLEGNESASKDNKGPLRIPAGEVILAAATFGKKASEKQERGQHEKQVVDFLTTLGISVAYQEGKAPVHHQKPVKPVVSGLPLAQPKSAKPVAKLPAQEPPRVVVVAELVGTPVASASSKAHWFVIDKDKLWKKVQELGLIVLNVTIGALTPAPLSNNDGVNTAKIPTPTTASSFPFVPSASGATTTVTQLPEDCLPNGASRTGKVEWKVYNRTIQSMRWTLIQSGSEVRGLIPLNYNVIVFDSNGVAPSATHPARNLLGQFLQEASGMCRYNQSNSNGGALSPTLPGGTFGPGNPQGLPSPALDYLQGGPR